MATALEIVRGISQVLTHAYDGAHKENYTDDGKSHSFGLKREEGDPITDSRVVDGFSVRFHGPYLDIHYNSEVRLEEVHENNFESEIEHMINEIAKFLKKEYKNVTGDTLTLTVEGEVSVLVQNISRRWSTVHANRLYKIGGLDSVTPVGEASEERLRAATKSFLELGKDAKTPRNVTRKEA